MKPVISGAYVLIYSRDAEADRAFFSDVLGLDSVDSGGGWLIFALPPSELALHPTDEADDHELYLLCDDIEATAKELERKGVPSPGRSVRSDGAVSRGSPCRAEAGLGSTSRSIRSRTRRPRLPRAERDGRLTAIWT